MLGQLDAYIAFAVVILGVSLLITVLNQTIVALLSMRGANLRWGIQTLLQEVDPRLAAHAKVISEKVLLHPLISDSTLSGVPTKWPVIGWLITRWKLGSAIRADELKKILNKLAVDPAVPNSDKWRTELFTVLAADDARAKQRLQAASDSLALFAPGANAQIDKVAPQVAAQMQKAVGDIDLWFDSVMDRVSQRFAARLRVWTMVWAILVAFVIHLDASRVLHQIQADPQLRARLVSATDVMVHQAERVLDTAVPDAATNAIKRLHSESDELKGLAAPPDPTTRTGALVWLVGQKLSPEVRARLTARFEELLREETKTVIEGLAATAGSIRQDLQTAGLQIFPDFTQHKRTHDTKPDWWPYNEAVPPDWNDHFFGVLFSAVLLSLGAPFWFNTLKTLSGLKPILASKQEKETAR
jgi:hypothetical protein